jgi:hypothetical protein
MISALLFFFMMDFGLERAGYIGQEGWVDVTKGEA